MKFKGSWVALVTPFNVDGSVNYSKFDLLLDFHYKNRTDGLVILGTTGEASTINAEEKEKIVDYVVKFNRRRLPIMVGTGSNDTQKVIADSKKFEKMGVDSILVVTPYYNKTNHAGLYKHFEMISQAVNLPIVLYNIPSRTGIDIPFNVLEQLVKLPNISGIKEASGNMSYTMKVATLISNSFELISGNDDIILPILSIGGSGVISVAANIFPREIHEIVEFFYDGNIIKSQKNQLSLLSMINALFEEVNPIPVKEMMNLRGFEVGPCRMPLYQMSDDAKSRMIKAFKL